MTKTTFKYNGKKNIFYSIAQGFSLFVAICAMVAFFSIGGESIFSDYLVELIIVSVIVIGMVIRLLKKSQKTLHTH